MSARLRLTLSYVGFLLVACVALFALVFYILRFVPDQIAMPLDGEFIPDRDDLIAALWPRMWQVLAVLTVIGLVGGWFLAGRMLRPLQQINGVARQVAAGSLDHRVNFDGRNDEFGELADTLDSMLDRLQASFDEQRRFAANAAHELRTPYAIERSILEVLAADPGGQDVPLLISRLAETNRRGIEVVEALLALATLDSGRELPMAPIDIAETVAAVVRELQPLADDAGVHVTARLGEGDIDGSSTLVRQLVANLVLNGIRHNLLDDGWMTVRTDSTPDGRVELVVSNSGQQVAPEVLATLTEPFVRGAGRVGTSATGVTGSGLGLSLVARVAEVHGATLDIAARETGGLVVTVVFPAPIENV